MSMSRNVCSWTRWEMVSGQRLILQQDDWKASLKVFPNPKHSFFPLLKFLKSTTGEEGIQTWIYPAQRLHPNFSDPLNVVMIRKTNRTIYAWAYVILFSSDCHYPMITESNTTACASNWSKIFEVPNCSGAWNTSRMWTKPLLPMLPTCPFSWWTYRNCNEQVLAIRSCL